MFEFRPERGIFLIRRPAMNLPNEAGRYKSKERLLALIASPPASIASPEQDSVQNFCTGKLLIMAGKIVLKD